MVITAFHELENLFVYGYHLHLVFYSTTVFLVGKNEIYNGRQGGVYIFGEGRGLVEHNNIYGEISTYCFHRRFIVHFVVCCLPTPLTLVCGGSPIIPLFGPPTSISLHLASYPITPAGSVPQNPGVIVWWVCGCS